MKLEIKYNNDNRNKLNLKHATTTAAAATAITVLPQFVPAKRYRHSQRNTARDGKGKPPLTILS